jgi:enoyl-CoA hydratase/carnithine racemase
MGIDVGWKNINFKKENKIGFIILNRPEVYNALNAALLGELGEVVEEVKRDSDIGVVILTGGGRESLCVGS